MASHKWTYPKDGGENFPIASGDLWAIGPHRFACLDITTSALDDFLLTLPQMPRAMYSDPPWNTGNVRSFYTKAGLPKGPELLAIVNAVMRLAARIGGIAFVEAGKAEVQIVADAVVAANGRVSSIHPITYYQKHPCRLLATSWGPAVPSIPFDGIDDDDTPRLALSHLLASGALAPGNAIIDPCTGRGLTPTTAASLGLVAYGTELSPWRLSVTLTKMRSLLNLQPEKIGTLAT